MNRHQQTQEPNESGETLKGVEQFESMLRSWRAHVDEFLVQLDLAHMELRDNISLTREASTSLEVNLEKRIASFRRSLADLGQAAGWNPTGRCPGNQYSPGPPAEMRGRASDVDRTMVLLVRTMVPTRRARQNATLQP